MAILNDSFTTPLVAEYFRTNSVGTAAFSGPWFERIGGGGDNVETRDRITTDDLVAVQMLSVTVPPHAVIRVLGPEAEGLSTLLRKIPVDKSPDDAEGARLLRDSASPLRKLWERLHGHPGVGWVTAGKLCARKRPALAPVYDQHVRDAAGAPQDWWSTVCELFTDADFLYALNTLRDVASNAGGDVTLLRIFDIAIWMRQHGYQWASEDLHPPDGPLQI